MRIPRSNEGKKSTNNSKEKTAATNTNYNITSRSRDEESYVLAVYSSLRKVLARRARANNFRGDANELGSRCIEKVLMNTAKFMVRYPDAQHCANALARKAIPDYRRDESIQRCEGARRTRSWESGDADFYADAPDAGSVFDNHAMSLLEPDSFINLEMFQSFISDLRAEIGEQTWKAFMMMHDEEKTQEEAATAVGIRRETLNRQLAKMRQIAVTLSNSPKYRGWLR